MALSLHLILWAITFCVGFTTSHGMQCFTGDNHEVQNCYTERGLAAPDTPSYISALLNEVQNLANNCMYPNTLKEAVRCAFQVVRDCVASNAATETFTRFVPFPSRAGQSVDKACSNAQHWNEACFSSRSSEYTKCLTDFIQSLELKNLEEKLCATFKYSEKCLKSTLGICGCSTVKLLMDVKESYQLHPCGPSAHEPVHCDPKNPSKFTGINGASVDLLGWPTMIFFTLVSSLLTTSQ